MKKIPPNAIRNWVSRNFKYKERKDGDELLICSPFDGDTKYKFNINPKLGLCNDWRGNDRWAGQPNIITGKRNCSFLKFVQLYKNCGYVEALRDILGAGHFVIDESEKKKEIVQEQISLPDGCRRISDNDDIFTTRIKKWLYKRGLTDESINKYSLHYDGYNTIWPYLEYDELVYWQSRSCLDKKFLYPSGTNKGDYLYGFDDVEPASYIIITEAIFGSHTLGDQSVSSGGAILADGQIRKIRALGPRDGVILAPDLDHAGIMSIIDNKNKLSAYKLYYSLPSEMIVGDRFLKDWNEFYEYGKMPFNDIRKMFDNNIKPVDYKACLELMKYANQLKIVRS